MSYTAPPLKLTLVLALFALALLPIGSYALAQSGATCDGQRVTVDLALGQLPTAGADVILGTDGPDLIAAGDGDDVVCGGGGDDQIWGQLGNDRLLGEAGDDKLRGGDGDDVLLGGSGADDLNGGRDDDFVSGGADADLRVRGGTGVDVVNGDDGDDLLVAGNGGEDTVSGGAGNDALVTGGPRPDTVNGNDGDDQVKGNGGADIVNGGAGNDMLFGGAQPDTLDGGPGTDDCNGGIQDDTAVNCESLTNIESNTTVTPVASTCEEIAAQFVTNGSANADLPDPEVNATCVDGNVIVTSNGIPDFPYIETSPGNPDAFDLEYTIPATPVVADATTPVAALGAIAVAINGVPIYGATEGTGGDVMSLGGGFTECGGHNGPTGYHYHTFDVTGSDDCLFSVAEAQAGPVLFGYAFDGYPIYGAIYQYTSSYQLTDPSLFATDTWGAHTYVAGSGDLDECNGRTDEAGNYAYYATETFPYTVGCYRGVVDESANAGGGAGPGGGPGGPPPGGGPGGPPPGADSAVADTAEVDIAEVTS